MPIFEFKCNDCDAKFEKFMFSAAKIDKVVCKKCKSANVTKLVSDFASWTSQSNTNSDDSGRNCTYNG